MIGEVGSMVSRYFLSSRSSRRAPVRLIEPVSAAVSIATRAARGDRRGAVGERRRHRWLRAPCPLPGIGVELLAEVVGRPAAEAGGAGLLRGELRRPAAPSASADRRRRTASRSAPASAEHDGDDHVAVGFVHGLWGLRSTRRRVQLCARAELRSATILANGSVSASRRPTST